MSNVCDYATLRVVVVAKHSLHNFHRTRASPSSYKFKRGTCSAIFRRYYLSGANVVGAAID